jgi:cytidylate kinase
MADAKKTIITINGWLGSGKSSTAKKIAEKLGYKHFSSGDFFRQVGIDLGLSVTELNIRAEGDPKIDVLVDDKLRAMRDAEKVVIDSRTAYHWIPESFKVYLTLPREVAKERILKNLKENPLRQKSETSGTEEEVYNNTLMRFESEQKRYWDLYKIKNTELQNYDLVIDTEKNNLEQVVEKIITEYKKWLDN